MARSDTGALDGSTGARLHETQVSREPPPRADEHRAHDHHHEHHQPHGHSHGLVDPSIKRSRAGLRAVGLSLGILGATALAQGAIFAFSNSVALLADLIHNVGDALTAVPLGIAFLLRSERAERMAGLAVVLAIFISPCVAFYEAFSRLIHPQDLFHLWALAAAGMVGFLGNELAPRCGCGRAGVSRVRRSSQTATTPA
jgi:Co/Zn/Cd efflux system component